jgi:hypothetical protein
LLCDFIFGDALGRATDREPGNTKEVDGIFGTPLEVDDFPPDELDDTDGEREDAGGWKAFRVGEDGGDDPEYNEFGPLSIETEIFGYWIGGSNTRTTEDVARGD